MSATGVSIDQLSGQQRQLLDAWLLRFDQSWHGERLQHAANNPPEELKAFRRLYLTELVKIDLRHNWQEGQLRRVEGYLAQYPDLGTAETVSIDVILAEYRAGKALGRTNMLEDLLQRFPARIAEMKDRLGPDAARRLSEQEISHAAATTGTDEDIALEIEPPKTNASPTPAAKQAATSTSPPGQLGKYRIERKLGAGTTSEVYLARDTQLDRRVALKTMHFSAAVSEEDRQEFFREAKSAVFLRHANICPVHDVGEIGGVYFLVMSYIEGRSLTDFIDPKRPFTESRAAMLVAQLALATAEAHSLDYVHGNLSPQNIRIGRDREPMIMNFGVPARALRESGMAYWSPEQVEEAEYVGPASDQYSLGVILFELLTGRPPIDGTDDEIRAWKQSEEVPAPSSFRSDLDPRLDEIVLRMTSRYVEDRFPDMAAAADALNAITSPSRKAKETPATRIGATSDGTVSESGSSPAAAAKAAQTTRDAKGGYDAEQQSCVDVLKQRGDYAAAKDLLRELAGLQRPEYSDLAKWARGQLQNIDRERRDAQAQVVMLIDTAEDLFDRHDYDEVLRILEGVPEKLRNAHVRHLRKEARNCLEEIEQQWQEVEKAKRRKDDDALFRAASRLEQLKPGDSRMRSLRKEVDRLDKRADSNAMSPLSIVALIASLLVMVTLGVGAVFLFRAPKTGLVRIESNNRDLEILIDDEPVSLVGKTWEGNRDAGSHSLRVRIDGVDLKFEGETKVDLPDGSIVTHELNVTINGVGVSTGSFDVVRLQPTILTISHKQSTKPPPPKPDPEPKTPMPEPPKVADKEQKKKPIDPGPEKNEPEKKDPEPKEEAELQPPEITKLVVLRGHTAPIRSVAWTVDSRRIVTGSNDGTAIVWDAEGGKPERTIRGDAGKIFSISLSPDGRFIVGGTEANTAVVWNIDTGAMVTTLRGHQADLYATAVAPNGRRVATGSFAGGIVVWNAQTGGRHHGGRAHNGAVFSLAYSEDSSLLLSASADKSARLWNAETGQLGRRFIGHTHSVRDAAFLPGGKQLVTASWDKSAIIWDVESAKEVHKLTGHEDKLWTVAVSPGGNWIVTGASDKKAMMWNASTGKSVATLEGHSKTIHDVAFSPDGKHLVTASADNTAIVWKLDAAKPKAKQPDAGKKPKTDEQPSVKLAREAVLRGNTGTIRGVSWTRDGKRVATGAIDGRVILWNPEDGTVIREMRKENERIFGVSFSKDGNQVAGASGANVGVVWNASNGQVAMRLRGHSADVHCVAYSNDGKRIVGTGHVSGFYVWHGTTGAQVHRIPGAHSGSIPVATFSPNDKFIVTGSKDTTLKLWDAVTGREIRTYRGHTETVRDVAFLPDGKHFVSCSWDKTAIIWNRETGDIVRKLDKHEDKVWCVAVSPDGKWIATGSSDKTVILWNAATGEVATTLDDHSDIVYDLAFSPDGKRLVTASADKSAIIWKVDVTEPAKKKADAKQPAAKKQPADENP